MLEELHTCTSFLPPELLRVVHTPRGEGGLKDTWASGILTDDGDPGVAESSQEWLAVLALCTRWTHSLTRGHGRFLQGLSFLGLSISVWL